MYLYDSMTKIMNLFISKNHITPDEILKKYFNELQLWRNEENEIDILVQSHFFNFETKKWLVDENEPIMKFFFYNSANNTLLIFDLYEKNLLFYYI